MRLSSVFGAVVAASTVLSVSTPSRGETPDLANESTSPQHADRWESRYGQERSLLTELEQPLLVAPPEPDTKIINPAVYGTIAQTPIAQTPTTSPPVVPPENTEPENTEETTEPENTPPIPEPENTQPENTPPTPEPENTPPIPELENAEPIPELENAEPIPELENAEPENTQPTPGPENTQPTPGPENTQPTPGPENTQPTAEPENTQPTAEPENTQPTAEPENTQPTAEPENTQPQSTPTPQPPPPVLPPSPRPQTAPPVLPGPPVRPQPGGQSQPEVLVAEVSVRGVSGELEDLIYEVISLRPGRTTTRAQLQEDINAIFATGFFAKVRAEPEDTPLGVRVTFVVEANPALERVEVRDNQVLPQSVVDEIFSEQYGEILNIRQLQQGIREINQWYRENGYVLARVIDSPPVTSGGTVILEVAEGTVADIQIRFLNKDGEPTDENGEPIKGRTRDYVILRELQMQPGDTFNRTTVERDLQRVFGLGIFEDVQLSLDPSPEDPREVIVVVNAIEKNTGSVAAGAGVSSASGLFGTVSYQEQNLFGRNQKLGSELQVGQRELLYDIRFTDPWIKGDPYRTSYTINGFRRRTLSLIFDGGDRDVELPNGDRPRILRFGGGVNFSRPINRQWRTSVGLQYQRVSIRDSDGDLSPEDELGNTLSFSEDGTDDLLTLQFATSYDRRNSVARTTQGSVFRLSTEQSIPIGLGNIFMNRLRGSVSHYMPVGLIRFSSGPQVLALNLQGGTIIGDVPPYEAFSLGGSTSVRGYDEGDVGTGRSFIQGTLEYRFPVFSVIGGALFFDAATDLGTGSEVPGDPAGARDKPGNGFGYGLGVRIQSPLGPIRVDYGINDEGNGRFHFGLGERF